MDLFRRKQKLIFWLVTIIIVPSFVLVWGVSGLFDRSGASGGGGSLNVGVSNGENLSYAEFESFRRRMQAALGGYPLQFAGAPGAGTPNEELFKYLFAYSLLKDAEKAGTMVSDLQVGTFLERVHPYTSERHDKSDPKSMEKLVDQFCRQMQITRADFLKGIREWQSIGNYIVADANLAAINDDTVFAYSSVNQAECVLKRVRILPTEAINEQAKKDVTEKPASELEDEARKYIESKADDAKYRDSASWRFAYVWMPLPAQSTAQPATEEEIVAQYNAGRETRYAGVTLDVARPAIAEELNRRYLERQAARNFTYDVDPQLRAHPELSPAELAKLTQLAKYGVKTGDTGPEPVKTENLSDHLPAGVSYELAMLLDLIDSAPEQARKELLDQWMASYSLETEPMPVEDGYLRLRLLEFNPSTPAPINGPDGAIDKELFELALADMVADRVDELVQEKAVATEADIRAVLDARRAGTAEPDKEIASEFDQLPTETLTYIKIADQDYELGRLSVGEMIGPNAYTDPETGARGRELVVLADRRVPTRAAFDAEPANVRNGYRQMVVQNFRGNYGFTATEYGPAAIIQPSPSIMAGIADRFNRGEIRVNPELLVSGTEG